MSDLTTTWTKENGIVSVATPKAKKSFFYRPELDCLRFFAFMAVFVHHTIPRSLKFYSDHHLPASLSNIANAGAFGVDSVFLSQHILNNRIAVTREGRSRALEC
jgi:hypothetical protein